MKRSLLVSACLWLLIMVGLDQAIKYCVDTSMFLGEDIELLPFLSLYHTRNPGIAFSMLSSFNDLGLILLTMLIIGFVTFLWYRTAPTKKMARWGYLLIMSGAIGNLIDRIRFNYVIDYIHFHIDGLFSFAVFNLADAFITIGALCIIVDEFFGSHHKKQQPHS